MLDFCFQKKAGSTYTSAVIVRLSGWCRVDLHLRFPASRTHATSASVMTAWRPTPQSQHLVPVPRSTRRRSNSWSCSPSVDGRCHTASWSRRSPRRAWLTRWLTSGTWAREWRVEMTPAPRRQAATRSTLKICAMRLMISSLETSLSDVQALSLVRNRGSWHHCQVCWQKSCQINDWTV